MRPPPHTWLVAAARFYAPLIAMFALLVAIVRPAGAGAGFVAGLALLLAAIAHALVFGADAARAAAPPWLLRLATALGLSAAVVGATGGEFAYARELVEAGAFVVTAAGGALIVMALFGRAPTMRDQAP